MFIGIAALKNQIKEMSQPLKQARDIIDKVIAQNMRWLAILVFVLIRRMYKSSLKLETRFMRYGMSVYLCGLPYFTSCGPRGKKKGAAEAAPSTLFLPDPPPLNRSLPCGSERTDFFVLFFYLLERLCS